MLPFYLRGAIHLQQFESNSETLRVFCEVLKSTKHQLHFISVD